MFAANFEISEPAVGPVLESSLSTQQEVLHGLADEYKTFFREALLLVHVTTIPCDGYTFISKSPVLALAKVNVQLLLANMATSLFQNMTVQL